MDIERARVPRTSIDPGLTLRRIGGVIEEWIDSAVPAQYGALSAVYPQLE